MIHNEICTNDRKTLFILLPWKRLQFNIVITAKFETAVTEIDQHCKIYILSKNIIGAKTLWTRQSIHSTTYVTPERNESVWSFYNKAIKTEYKTVFLMAQIWTQRPLGFSLKSYMYIRLLGKTPFKIINWSTCNYIGFSFILGAFAKLRKTTITFVIAVRPSVCLSVQKEQLCSHWMEFH